MALALSLARPPVRTRSDEAARAAHKTAFLNSSARAITAFRRAPCLVTQSHILAPCTVDDASRNEKKKPPDENISLSAAFVMRVHLNENNLPGAAGNYWRCGCRSGKKLIYRELEGSFRCAVTIQC